MKILSKISFLVLCLGLLATGCKKTAGDKAKTGDAKEVSKTAQSAMAYEVNPAMSKVLWTGSKPTGTHTGTINLSHGSLFTTNGMLSGGTFTLDMTSLVVTDLKPEDGKASLEDHLKGMTDDKADDFFNVRQYPNATFTITNVAPNTTNPDANVNITGNLRIKKTEKSVTFPASAVVVGDKVSAVTPAFKIDRTLWGINFQSKSVFADLKDKFINDEVSLNIQLEAAKK